MNNLYYYAFYLLGIFFRKINRRNKTPDFSAMSLLSIPISLNIISLIDVLGLFPFDMSESYVLFISVLVIIPILIGNNYLLIKGKKSEKIINYFIENPKSKGYKSFTIFLIILYIVFSFVLAIHLAQEHRKLMGL